MRLVDTISKNYLSLPSVNIGNGSLNFKKKCFNASVFCIIDLFDNEVI